MVVWKSMEVCSIVLGMIEVDRIFVFNLWLNWCHLHSIIILGPQHSCPILIGSQWWSLIWEFFLQIHLGDMPADLVGKDLTKGIWDGVSLRVQAAAVIAALSASLAVTHNLPGQQNLFIQSVFAFLSASICLPSRNGSCFSEYLQFDFQCKFAHIEIVHAFANLETLRSFSHPSKQKGERNTANH